MKTTLNVLRIFGAKCRTVLIVKLVILALFLVLARAFLPELERFRPEVEALLSEQMGQPLSIAKIQLGWHGLGPRILLSDVKLFDHDGNYPLLVFEHVHVDISLPDSLLNWRIDLGSLTLSGLELTVVRARDGSLRVEGVSAGGGAVQTSQSDHSAMLEWFFSQDWLELESSRIVWRDLQGEGHEWLFDDVNLQLLNEGEQHHLGGSLELPHHLGKTLTLALDMRGAGSDPRQWSSRFFAAAKGVDLAQLSLDFFEPKLQLERGHANLRVWGEWGQGALQALQGEFSLRQLRLSSPQKGAFDLNALAASFAWRGNVDEWSLDIDHLRLTLRDNPGPESRVQVTQKRSAQGNTFTLAADYARIDDLVTLALASPGLNTEWVDPLRGLQPQGEIHNLFLRLQQSADGNSSPQFFLRSHLKALALQPWQEVPGLSAAAAIINLDQDSGVIDLTTQGAQVDVARLFREPLQVDRLEGRIAWARFEHDWQIELRQLELSNQDVALSVAGQLYLAAEGESPRVNIRGNIERGDISATSRYLPAKIMPPGVLQWLDNGLVSGQVTSGSMLLRGPLRRFPFKDNSGRFEIRFNVSDGILDYVADWPRLEQLEAEVVFINQGMQIQAVSATMLNSEVGPTEVSIADFRGGPARLMIDGTVHGPSNDGILYLNGAPPLKARFGSFLGSAKATGESRLALSLELPLTHAATPILKGRVDLEQSELLFDELNIDLRRLNGVLHFSHNGLQAEGLEGLILGQPAQVDINTVMVSKERGSELTFTAQGTTDFAELKRRVELKALEFVEGESHWRAKFTIPAQGDDKPPHLELDSDLVGSRVTLPELLAKAPERQRKLSLQAEFGVASAQWQLNYGGLLYGVFEMASDPAARGLTRGELRFGSRAEMPKKEGLRIAGSLARFSEPAWRPLTGFGEEAEPAAANAEKSPINQVDLEIQALEFLSQKFLNVGIRAKREGAVWRTEFVSKELGGRVDIPEDFSQALVMDLDYLHLPKSSASEAVNNTSNETFNPADLPPLRVDSRRLTYGGEEFGTLHLITDPVQWGLEIKALELRSEVVDVDASGRWSLIKGVESSSIEAVLDIHKMGRLLDHLGYVASVKNGQGKTQLNLSWTGAPYDYDLESMRGTVRFDLEQGRLLEVEPGAGRFFGLLSIQTLPRRLMLDFSDFFGKGFAFDEMKGSFTFKEGSAETSDFIMDGPSAQIVLKGRVGLVAEDYDQEMVITPHVTSSLPLLTAIAATPAAGAVVWLGTKLFRKKINKATQMLYKVSGPWSDPVVERVLPEPEK